MQTLTPQLIEQRLLEQILDPTWGKASGNEIAHTVIERLKWKVPEHSGVFAGILLAWLEYRTYEPQEIVVTNGNWRCLSGIVPIFLREWNLIEAGPRLRVLRQRMPRNTPMQKYECDRIDQLIQALESDLPR